MMDKYLKAFEEQFSQTIYQKFTQAAEEFNLINNGDKIAVCISGGKDSMMLAKCFELYKLQGKKDFEVINLVMDPGYRQENRQKILDNAKKLGITIEIFDSDIFRIVENAGDSPCYLCARMRRGTLYAAAQNYGCNKIALGHHFDDVIETVLMGVLYNGQVQSMPPVLKSKNFKKMELIRPLYYVREKDIISWRDAFELDFLLCACRFTQENQQKKDSKRLEIKRLIQKLCKQNARAADNIFVAAKHINLNYVSGFKTQKNLPT